MMRMKKPFQTAGVTLLGAVSLLLVGTLLFVGVWTFLPDRTGETHSHSVPSFPSEAGKVPELYPWDRMTTLWVDGADTFHDDELFGMLDPFLAPQQYPPTLHVSPYVINWSGGEFLCDETQTLCGFRNVEIWVRSYTDMVVEKYGVAEIASEAESILQYRFSLALREWYGSTEVCFFSLEPPPREEAFPDAEEAGLTALTEWVTNRELDLDSGSPFASFLWRFVVLCSTLECDYESYNAAMQLFETGLYEIALEDHVVYCTFTGKEGEITLLCDPVSQTVYGISIRRF